ncbi:hypothetical protein [Nocardioides taihuensis]|uniref:Uncharacterized protein n=1 Tax=Nocardioides taihuensis TaxID=1835606 RepID=A0ABW0BDB5_9ACTN
MSEFEFRAEKASPRAGGVPRAVDLSGDVVAAAALAHATQLATGVVTTGSTSTLSGSTTGSSSVSLPTPSPTTTLLTTATTPVTSSGSPASPLARWDFSQEAASALTDRVAPLLEVQGVTPACATDARGCRAFITTGTPVDADGDPVSVDEATREIVRLLVATRVETSPGSEGEPVGELVSADVELTGLRGESVDVLWSMFGRSARGPLPPAWQGSHLAYRLHPSSDHDTGSVSLWVPVPRAPGKYVIQLELRVDGAALDTADTRPFGGPDDA